MVKFSKLILSLFAVLMLSAPLYGQILRLNVNANDRQQTITGFGGFVNSPIFQYGHMSESEIRKMWGANSEAGYNIMRLYIPSSKAYWQQTVSTAKLAKSLGLVIFASPWSPPAEWKTNNSSSGVTDGVEGFLREDKYADYANYLNDFVIFLRNNGVELDYISIQNEPDFKIYYEGCSWTPEQITKFLKNHASKISCKIIAPETVGISNNYATALQASDVLPHFNVYGGHQYGGIQSTYKNFKNLGKNIWMTEYLINWNENKTPRDFNWNIDAFDFTKSINDAMLGNFDAWVHYTTKRFYGLMGDGTYGSTTGQITKRGYILSHYAKYTTGYTRLGTVLDNAGTNVQASAYVSPDGKKVTVMLSNPTANNYNMRVDLPFNIISGEKILTNANQNMLKSNLNYGEKTPNPYVNVDASSVLTLVFYKDSDVQNNTAKSDLIESQKPTSASFGTTYKLSNTTTKFANANPLVSANIDANKGYLALNDTYSKLVFNVKGFSSSYLSASDNTTLYYVNAAGRVNSKNYGKYNFPTNTEFDMTFDISPSSLPDGIKGIIGLRNSNYSSILTMTFGDVYFVKGNQNRSTFGRNLSDETNKVTSVLPSTIRIYPIPTKNELFIEDVKVNSKVEIYDAKGALVLSQTASVGKSVINLSTLLSGVYIVKITNANQTITKKIVKE